MFKTTFITRLSSILLLSILIACSSERSRFAAGVYHTQKKKTSETAIRQQEKAPARAADTKAVKETDPLPLTEPQAVTEEMPAKSLTEAASAAKGQSQAERLKGAKPAKVVSTKQARQMMQQLKKEYKPSAKAAAQAAEETNDRERSWLVALLLCFFLGGIGIHRFYLGYTWQGVVQLVTLGCCGIWTLIDFIRIITRDLVPKGGDYKD